MDLHLTILRKWTTYGFKIKYLNREEGKENYKYLEKNNNHS